MAHDILKLVVLRCYALSSLAIPGWLVGTRIALLLSLTFPRAYPDFLPPHLPPMSFDLQW